MMPPMMGGARWFLYRVSAFFLRPYGGISTGPRAPRISSLGRDASGGTKNNSAALKNGAFRASEPRTVPCPERWNNTRRLDLHVEISNIE